MAVEGAPGVRLPTSPPLVWLKRKKSQKEEFCSEKNKDVVDVVVIAVVPSRDTLELSYLSNC